MLPGSMAVPGGCRWMAAWMLLWFSTAGSLLGFAQAQDTAQDEAWREAPPVSTGIAVGKKIPAFSVPDQNGRPRDFKSIVGPSGAMIVFQRSVDW